MDELLNNAPCGFFIFNDEGVILNINETLASRLGYSREELINKKLESILSISSRIFYHTHFFPLLSMDNQLNEIFITFNTRDKNQIPYLINASRKFKDAIYSNHVVAISVQQRRKYEAEIINAKKAAEKAVQENQELTQAKEELDKKYQQLDAALSDLKNKNQEFLSLNNIFTHELREPLRKIMFYTNMLSDNIPARLSKDQIIYKIGTFSEQLKELIEGLQNYIDISQSIENYTDINMQTLFQQVKNGFPEEQAQLIQILPSEALEIKGNNHQLVLMFRNIITNCFTHNPNQKDLRIEISFAHLQENLFRSMSNKYKYNDYVRVTISDNGKGIDYSYADYIFEALKKLEITNRLGLGLSISKKIANNHMGFIRLKKNNLPGATFEVFLPIQKSNVSVGNI